MGQIKSFLLSALGGLAVLTAVNMIPAAAGLAPGWSGFSLGVSAVFGLPGAVALLLIKAIG